MTNAVVMPYVLEANRAAIEPIIDRLAAYVDIAGGFDGFVEHLVALRDSLDVPHRLVDLGVDATQVATIAEAAAVDPSAAGNPIPFTAALAAEVFTRACEGQLEGTR